MAVPYIFDDADFTAYGTELRTEFLKRLMDPVDDHAVTQRWCAPPPRGTGFVHRGFAGNNDDDLWIRRNAKRTHTVKCARNSFWHTMVLVLASTGDIAEEEAPVAPDPDDRTISRRD